ncbi:MAG: hypothetical protein IJO39_09845 [Clostridia bacterium]|nr:hypothetical protein [Clostridia bacterium]
MLKKLFDFKLSKPLLIAKVFMLVCFVAAIVITWFGLVEIMDVKHMKEVLDATRPTMGGVLLYLVKKYLGWAVLVAAVGGAGYIVTRYKENNK